MALSGAPALRRLRESSGRLLGHHGGTRSFQRYAKTKDWERGKTTQAATGAPIEARCDFEDRKIDRSGGSAPDRRDVNPAFGDRKVRVVERVLVVEVEPFEAVGGLTDGFRFVDDDGVERRIKSAVLNTDQTEYIVHLEH